MRLLPAIPAPRLSLAALPARPLRAAAVLLFCASTAAAMAQTVAPAPVVPPLTTIAPFARPGLAAIPVIRQPALAGKPLTVTGARGAILGEQSGVVELWQLPVKVFSNLHLRAEIDGYTVPLELNPGAAEVEVRPGHTILTYSFAGITVRQHMLVSPAHPGSRSPIPNSTVDDPGALLYFEIESVRPATLTVTLTPAMQQMWPAPQYGIPGAGWVPMPPSTQAPDGYNGGAYTVATDNPAVFGMIGMPRARPGHIPVYQEHPQTLPLEFLVRYDPAVDRGRLYPLLSTVAKPGETNNAAGVRTLQQRLADQAANLPALAAAIDTYYAHFFDTRLTVRTPDPRFDEALRWAALSIEDSQVEHITAAAPAPAKPATCQPAASDCKVVDLPVYDRRMQLPPSETGLVAGWFPSYDSTRPGFGWYFGRDTLWSLYAIDSYGDTALSKRALEFLLHRQRADGKMMHEFSQMADDLPPALTWSNFGYEYAAADATPLFLLALRDYVRTSGDTQFVADHWDQVKKAWQFERTHDSDGDGVYDNSQGTGWVENWQSPMPHQELYLAALDHEAANAMADLATLQHDDALAQSSRETAAKLAAAVEQYRDPATGLYAFSKNANGSYDRTLTVYPAVALWFPPASPSANPGAPFFSTASPSERVGSQVSRTTKEPLGAPCPASGTWDRTTSKSAGQTCTYGLQHPEAMLQSWSSPLLATDWGTRALATTVPFYDPISYHMGSVWPLFTGWNAMAQYNTNHPAAAWLTLQQNLRLTFAEDPGTVTEVLSGAFYQPMGRSSAHQLWSSAMTLAPAIRGLFGIQADATTHTLTVHPHLPVTWNEATLSNVRLGTDLYTVHIARRGRTLDIETANVLAVSPVCMPASTGGKAATPCKAALPSTAHTTLPLPAVEFGLYDPAAPLPGDTTHLPHITNEQYFPDRTEFDLEAEAGTTVLLDVRRNGNLAPAPEPITLPAGTGYVTRHVTLSAKP